MLKPLTLIALLGFALPLSAETTPELFQAALTAEKDRGDLRAAVDLYEAVVEHYRSGQGDARLAAHSQTRLRVLRQHLGIEGIPAVTIHPELRLNKGLDVAARRFQALREALGVKSISERITEISRQTEPDPAVGPLERRIQAFRTWLGIHGMAELMSDPEEYFKRRREVGPVERRVKAFIKALGMRGLPELMEEIQRNRRPPRPVSPVEFYQSGLTMEKGEGDLRAAVALYQQALDLADQIAPDLKEQIRRRLALCRKRLELQTDDKP